MCPSGSLSQQGGLIAECFGSHQDQRRRVGADVLVCSLQPSTWLFAVAGILALAADAADNDAKPFIRLIPLPPPRIVASAVEFPGGAYPAAHLVDGKTNTEYSSAGNGTNTFVEFEFDSPQPVAGFRHVDRNDPATIAASQLDLVDAGGGPGWTMLVRHVNRRAGITFVSFPEPVTVRRIRWRVTELGPDHHGTVGGAEIAFFAPGQPESAPQSMEMDVRAPSVVERQARGLVQPLAVTLQYPYPQPVEAMVRVPGADPRPVRLSLGSHLLEFTIPVVETERPLTVTVESAGDIVARRTVRLKPARKLTIYVLPHSHTDIGYTELQTAIEEKQINNLLRGLEISRRTASYPQGARFVWNVEVLWAADLFLDRLGPNARGSFLNAVQRGQVALNGMYLNELTGLCRPEELLRLFHMAPRMAAMTGVPIRSAMISDVPGYTWATVTAMAQAGIRYFSVAPNYFDRIGDVLQQWENKPFYWVSPSGREKVLVWIPWRGYAMSHIVRQMTPRLVEDFQQKLEESGYPYDIAHMRWAGHGDNAVPDETICEFVRDWNLRHEWPRFRISSTDEAFAAFEKRYGAQLPEVRGDWTPYWEDGAGSSSLETALNRSSSDRVAQAESLWSLLDPASYPVTAFGEAWRNVLLYSEHTWGAWCSVSHPSRPETLDQWALKRAYAAQADLQSRRLLSRAAALLPGKEIPDAVDLFNTGSWPRSEWVVIPRDFGDGLDRVTDDQGGPVPSQRLANGDLALFARDVPPFAARRFTVSKGTPHLSGQVQSHDTTLDNGRVKVVLDPKTGGIVELRLAGTDHNLADTASGEALNDYLYFNGENPADARRNGPVTIRVKERGPSVASLLVESEAPGCYSLTREVRLCAGLDYVELINTVDKQRLVAASYHAKEGKESLNFAFPFNVPGGTLRLELPFAVINPEQDLIPSACKNWFTVGRWADVTGADLGVTWITLDAPLLQVGGLTANLLNSQANPDVWRKRVEPTRKVYSWAMNNHWGTNYRAYQEGPVVFRYLLRPHRRYDPATASRLAIAQTQPLIPIRGRGPKPTATPRLRLSSDQVLVTGMKPSEDRRALILRLWEASGRDTTTRLQWATPKPNQVFLSDTSERPLRKATETLAIPAWGLVTLRAELSAR